MKLHIAITPTYDGFVEKFVMPVAAEDFDVVVHRTEGPNYYFRLGVIDEQLRGEEIFAFCGADVLFHKPCRERLVELLGDADMAAQGDSQGAICPDFMVMRPNDAMRKFWDRVILESGPHTFYDQGACNAYIREGMVRCVKLPMPEFFNTCACRALNGYAHQGWMPNPQDIPPEARIVHAACVVGVKEKWQVLELARRYLDAAAHPVQA